jgi:hypothetical protein
MKLEVGYEPQETQLLKDLLVQIECYRNPLVDDVCSSKKSVGNLVQTVFERVVAKLILD